MTKTKDLRDGMRQVQAEGEVIDVSSVRVVDLRTGGQARVAEALLKDDTGTIKVPLWDDQIDKVRKGAVVMIMNGYVSTFRGERQLNVGKYGRLDVA